MCGPAALMIASTAVSVIGSAVGGLQANAQAKYEAKIADRNAVLANEAANAEAKRTGDAARAHYRKVADLKGQQRVAAAANGVQVDYGTAANVLDDTDLMADEDLSRIYDQGAENVRGFDIQSSNSRSQAQAARQKGKGALIGAAFGAGSTVLGGATQFMKMKAG